MQLLPGPGPSSSPLYTLNSFLAGSLFLPAMLDTNTLNSYLDPLANPVTLYSCPLMLFLEFQCTNLPSELALLYSISYFRLGSPPSRGGRVHLSVKLVVLSHVTVLVMLNGPLGGPVWKSKTENTHYTISKPRFRVSCFPAFGAGCMSRFAYSVSCE